jgi:hypothetical protein
MAMPFIFGNHQCPFLTFRSVSVYQGRPSGLAHASREGFSFRSRSGAPWTAYAVEATRDAELGEKTRGTATVRKVK